MSDIEKIADELRKSHASSTSGEWQRTLHTEVSSASRGYSPIIDTSKSGEDAKANTDFIVAVHEHLPALLQDWSRLKEIEDRIGDLLYLRNDMIALQRTQRTHDGDWLESRIGAILDGN
jgi:hypothetical protein